MNQVSKGLLSGFIITSFMCIYHSACSQSLPDSTTVTNVGTGIWKLLGFLVPVWAVKVAAIGGIVSEILSLIPNSIVPVNGVFGAIWATLKFLVNLVKKPK